MRLLLDTHAILWALYEPDRLSRRAEEVIADLGNDLFISHVSILELANKAASKRLPLVGKSTERLLTRIEELQAMFLPIHLEDIFSAANLPLHHLDPLDRILVAQAQVNGLSLVTTDGHIPKYDVKTIWR